MYNLIPQELIERALALTGKTMEYIEEISSADWHNDPEYFYKLSIEKFCYYLLSQLFLARYCEEVEIYSKINDTDSYLAWEFWKAIMLMQWWDKRKLTSLLEKIPWNLN